MNLKGMVNHFHELGGGFRSARFEAFELRTAFQPIYAVNGELGLLYGVEALVRPVKAGAAILPLDFFASLDRPHAFAADWTCLTLHLANASAWHLKGTSLFVNLNPDASHLAGSMADGFEAYVALAEELGIAAERIVVEITERRAGSDAGLIQLVQRIKALGCRIAIDDFGIEGSNLVRVVELEPDFVKIDRDWFKALMKQSASRSLITAIVNRFKGMGSTVLFEGIETADEFNWARECGADLIQGWLFGRETHAEENKVDQSINTVSGNMLRHCAS